MTATNWKRVAQTLRQHAPKKFYRADDLKDFELAISLCEREEARSFEKLFTAAQNLINRLPGSRPALARLLNQLRPATGETDAQ